MLVAGTNFAEGKKWCQESYFFSKFCFVWGWASWRRAWKHYDVNMPSWPEANQRGFLEGIFSHSLDAETWRGAFQDIYDKEIDTWDYQLTFTSWKHSMLNIVPKANMISNLGFRQDATHTIKKNGHSGLAAGAAQFPLTHPAEVRVNSR